MRLKGYIINEGMPELKDGQYAVPMAKKTKVPKLNPKTNRMKNSKITKYLVTDVPPEERSFKNLPRYADKTPKCTFTQWLGLKGNGSDGCKGTDGKFYGWSHRAVYGFGVGDVIKPGHIGNKYQYTKEVQKKYNSIADKEGYEAADKYYNSITFEPYTIETEEEAKQHAIRFGRDVS